MVAEHIGRFQHPFCETRQWMLVRYNFVGFHFNPAAHWYDR
jgi:hypothetical protein